MSTESGGPQFCPHCGGDHGMLLAHPILCRACWRCAAAWQQAEWQQAAWPQRMHDNEPVEGLKEYSELPPED